MAQENITSVLDKDQATNISLDNFIYLIQGYGVNRDRWATLKQLFDADVLSRVEVKNVELTAGTSITISKDYNLVLVDNNQNSGASLAVNTPSEQSYRGVVDVVVRWRDQQTQRIAINIGNGTYYLSPQNGEWGRFFIGAEGRVWSYQVYVADHTVGEEFSGAGSDDNIPREWNVGKKGFSFKANNGGTEKEITLSFFNNRWIITGLGSFEGESRFNGNVTIGDLNNSKQVVINGRISKAEYNITSNVIEINNNYNLFDFTDDNYEEGDVVFVHNYAGSTKQVYCNIIGPSYVEIKNDCTIPFRCVESGENNSKWSPLADMEIKSVQ